METIENPTTIDHGPQTAREQRVPLFEQININVFWIANNFHWQALLAIVIPSMVAKFLDPAQKGFLAGINGQVDPLQDFVLINFDV